MRRTLLTLAALLALAAPAGAWERMTFPGEEFSAEWPAEPFAYPTTRTVKGKPTVREPMHHFGVYHDGAIFLVTSYARPRRDETLEHFVGQLLKDRWRVEWKTPAREVASGGVRGAEIGFESYGVAGVARVFRADGHAYVVRALSRPAGLPSVERFLNSFTLSERPQGRAIRVPDAAAQVAEEEGGPGGGARPEADMTRAVIVYYTEEARRNNVRGVVRLRALLTPEGRVSDVTVLKGLPHGLTGQAVLAAYCILFFPAEKEGRRVPQRVVIEYNFNIY